jgi:hypothetical protein
MASPTGDDREGAAGDSAPPIWEDTGILLFGLLLVGLGGLGLATGQAVLVLPADHRTGSSLAWVVSGPGGRVVAAGLLALGTGCLGRWRWGAWTRWPTRCGVGGAGLLVVGLLVAGLVRLVTWLA